jgi:hypothetical protein
MTMEHGPPSALRFPFVSSCEFSIGALLLSRAVDELTFATIAAPRAIVPSAPFINVVVDRWV